MTRHGYHRGGYLRAWSEAFDVVEQIVEDLELDPSLCSILGLQNAKEELLEQLGEARAERGRFR